MLGCFLIKLSDKTLGFKCFCVANKRLLIEKEKLRIILLYMDNSYRFAVM